MLFQYLFLIALVALLVIFADFTRRKGFDNLKIYRTIDNNRIVEGETFEMTMVLENNKRLPLFFLAIEEKIPSGLKYANDATMFREGNDIWHVSKYSVKWYERKKRIYTLVGAERGTYLIKNMRINVGDIFGFSANTKEEEDYVEILVYPRIHGINKYEFDITNFQGEDAVRRWIHKDPLFIKGIREYNVEDRMKDIHWKSSLKMNKLMVKDYDYTSERELVIILNLQCGDPYWTNIQKDAIDSGARIAASLAAKALKEGIPTGLWTNAQLVTFDTKAPNEIKPAMNSFTSIMEMCARVDLAIKCDFNEYLTSRLQHLNPNCTYVIISPYFNDKDINLITKMRKNGYRLKIIDVSLKSSLPNIEGIEKIVYKGGVK
ncbi:DUF58 domain-containing protein [Clostridium tunisiense]|uniref:DUF58 domain-containing protein n=1 Tax=Clostridium tunisiense TaxID=219748 RepID=UPI0003017635|nr:DUF58 domain-containing protein [Clostridium tunisiense]